MLFSKFRLNMQKKLKNSKHFYTIFPKRKNEGEVLEASAEFWINNTENGI